MIKCDKGCHAICDFCIYCEKTYNKDEVCIIDSAVCTLHNRGTDVCGMCEEFHCFNVT
jgi:hypothetical protein